MKTPSSVSFAVLFGSFAACQFSHPLSVKGEVAERPVAITILEKTESKSTPPIHLSAYTKCDGLEMFGPAGLSTDGGQTWTSLPLSPDFSANLPYGYRREDRRSVDLDPKSGRLVWLYNALDTPGLDPTAHEPPIAQNSYYVRYRVSTDGGRTWLFDERVRQPGYSDENPLDGVWGGKTGIYFGDIGSIPLFTRDDKLLVPLQVCPLDSEGQLYNPSKMLTYTDVVLLIGTWGDNDRLTWEISNRVRGDHKRTTRGVIEPTLAEMPDGRILMVMRGSNAGNYELPGTKWASVSEDGGYTWTEPEPWTDDTGASFFSPSSMSTLFTHSSGRVFWIGNITPVNSRGNEFRWPLVIGEVDPETLRLIESSIVTLDTKRDDDPDVVHLSHFYPVEDRASGNILVTAPRSLNGYKQRTWVLYRLGI